MMKINSEHKKESFKKERERERERDDGLQWDQHLCRPLAYAGPCPQQQGGSGE